MDDTGLEQSRVSSLKTAYSSESGAQNGAESIHGAATGGAAALVTGLAHALATDADLRRLAAVWGQLTADDRKVIARQAEIMAIAPQ